MTLIKKDIEKILSSELQLKKIDCNKMVNAFFNLVAKKSTNKIKIAKFGVFYKKITQERMGRNPLSGKEYIIKSFKKTVFKPSMILKNRIN
tara:strand:+ start:748 stop:1020 length:273 start_codon:yes stop_codon:yes gene_type:complete